MWPFQPQRIESIQHKYRECKIPGWSLNEANFAETGRQTVWALLQNI